MTAEQAKKRVEELINNLKQMSADLVPRRFDLAVKRERDATALEILLKGQLADESGEELSSTNPKEGHICPFCNGVIQ